MGRKCKTENVELMQRVDSIAAVLARALSGLLLSNAALASETQEMQNGNTFMVNIGTNKQLKNSKYLKPRRRKN